MSKFRVIIILLFAKHWTVGICTEPPILTTNHKLITKGATFTSRGTIK